MRSILFGTELILTSWKAVQYFGQNGSQLGALQNNVVNYELVVFIRESVAHYRGLRLAHQHLVVMFEIVVMGQ